MHFPAKFERTQIRDDTYGHEGDQRSDIVNEKTDILPSELVITDKNILLKDSSRQQKDNRKHPSTAFEADQRSNRPV